MRTITTKYPARCAECGHQIPVGTEVEWMARGKVRHPVTCPAQASLTGITVGGNPTTADLIRAELPTCIPLPDEEFIAWVGKLIMEEGGVDTALTAYAACNEFWDGEPGPTAYGQLKFYAAVPSALLQNWLIHPLEGIRA